MKHRPVRYARFVVVIVSFLAVWLVSCTPTNGPVTVTRGAATETAVEEPNAGWCAGGPELLTAADVGCFLAGADASVIRWLDEETAFLFADPDSIENWAGAAIIFHKPTNSMLVLDKFGDIDPRTSHFNSRAGFIALETLTADVNLMAGLKGQVQERNQTSAPNTPEIRLGVAWQAGDTTVFLVAIAGLEVDDGRFYCPDELWTIGEEMIAVEASCLERDPDAPVRMHFFESFSIRGNNERLVQLELSGVTSNALQVSQGGMSEETAVYLAALEPVTNRTLLLREETINDLENSILQIVDRVDSIMLANFEAVNEKSTSLRFLFPNSSAYQVHASEAINLNFLLPGEPEGICQRFREAYPGLGGIVSLSAIGLSEDGSQALVYVEKECGALDRTAAFYVLTKTADAWQITNTIEVSTELPV